ncbi:MAG: dienelactone hydrolase family protein [Woeseiaceae bacterium]|nr:dienelactone hydrolase family protein [Woeseiaceae bacterium]
MAIQTRVVDYESGDHTFEGMLAWDDAGVAPRPGVLVAHTIAGRSAHEEGRAKRLAEMGYVGFAMDVYGKGTQTTDLDRNRAMMDALRADREELQERLLAGLACLQEQPEVDAAKTAAIGFCFGGLSVLDIARTGADVAGVVSLHGIFDPPGNTAGNRITAKVLALHGWEDPLATPEQVVALADEMTAMRADWQVHAYGNTTHAFTNPAADDWDGGKQYDADADRRSWVATRNFLAELFGN